MDRFTPDEGGSEVDEGGIVSGGLFAPQGDAFETFELSDHLLDAGAGPVEP